MAGSSSNWFKPSRGHLKGVSVYVRTETMDALGMSRRQIAMALETGSKPVYQAIALQRPLTGMAQKDRERGIISGADPTNLATAGANLSFSRHEPVSGGSLNGIPLTRPKSANPWEAHQEKNLGEPPLPNIADKRIATGVVIVEPDGRVWLYEPSMHYDGLEHTLSGGGLETQLSPQQNARKEAWEELGLDVEITGFVGDEVDPGSFRQLRRFYLAKRVGGTPTDAAWEASSVKLVTPDKAREILTKPSEQALIDAAGSVARGGSPVHIGPPLASLNPPPTPARRNPLMGAPRKVIERELETSRRELAQAEAATRRVERAQDTFFRGMQGRKIDPKIIARMNREMDSVLDREDRALGRIANAEAALKAKPRSAPSPRPAQPRPAQAPIAPKGRPNPGQLNQLAKQANDQRGKLATARRELDKLVAVQQKLGPKPKTKVDRQLADRVAQGIAAGKRQVDALQRSYDQSMAQVRTLQDQLKGSSGPAGA